MTKSQKNREHAHARDRASERYGIHLTKALRLQLIEMIRSRNVMRSIRQSHTRTLHIVLWNDIEMVVIYSRTQKQIVTFLPREAWQLKEE